MKVLHILKTEPDDTVIGLITGLAAEEVKVVELFEGDVDWAELVDDIFTHDKVVCWW